MVRSWSLVLSVVAAIAVACGAPPRTSSPTVAANRRVARGTVSSNVQRADYAGSAACAVCHAELARAFAASPMHTMTRLPEGATIHAPFDGKVLRFGDETITLETRAGARWVHVDTPSQARESYRVTRVIGGRVREDFAGVASGSAGGVAGEASEERVLPISYLIEKKTLRYKGYSVMVRERPHLADGAVWNQTCIFCHNTSPTLLSLMGAVLAKPPSYQGVQVDRLLPEERRWTYEVTDERAFSRAIQAEIATFGGDVDASSLKRAATRGIAETRARFRGKDLVEVGIGCEACHGGSREHAKDPGLRPTFLPTSPFVRVREETTRAERISHACARCHQVLFSRYPWTWEGGRRDGTRLGGSNINSGEARDMLLGGCAKGLACPACHDPHATDGHARERAAERPEGNGVCTGCHAKYATPDALERHTHHSRAGAAGACVACHMPKKNMSLSSGLTRYHRIGSPTDPMRVMLDRPLECALCHADKTVEQVASDMERLWGKRYERETLRALYGGLDVNVLLATASLGKPHEQAVALYVLGEKKRADAAPLALAALTHPYPLVREYARDALEAILGHPCPVTLDVYQPADRVRVAAGKCGEFSQITPLAAQHPHEAAPEVGKDDPDDGED